MRLAAVVFAACAGAALAGQVTVGEHQYIYNIPFCGT